MDFFVPSCLCVKILRNAPDNKLKSISREAAKKNCSRKAAKSAEVKIGSIKTLLGDLYGFAREDPALRRADLE